MKNLKFNMDQYKTEAGRQMMDDLRDGSYSNVNTAVANAIKISKTVDIHRVRTPTIVDIQYKITYALAYDDYYRRYIKSD